MALTDFVKRLFGSRTPAAGEARDEPDEIDMSEAGRWHRALADFGFPHRIVPHALVEAELRREQELGAREGFSPIVIVRGTWNSTPIAPDERARRAEAARAERYDAAFGGVFLAAHFSALGAGREPDEPSLDVFETLRPLAEPPPQKQGLMLLERYDPVARGLRPVESAAIMRVPTADTTLVPVYLDWGGWNEVPQPLEIAAVARYWAETHGARLVAMSWDQLEFSVSRRPRSHGEAVAVLKEHFAFAPDSYGLDQAMLEGAAAELQVNHSWAFWWD